MMMNSPLFLAFLIFVILSFVCASITSDGSLFNSRKLSHSEEYSGVNKLKGCFSNRLLSATNIRGGGSHGKVIEIDSMDMFDKILVDSEDKLIVMDFSATWCGPCKMIAPHYAELSESEEFGRAVFLKVDVDVVPDLAQRFQVMSMPTFIFLKTGKELERFSGASVGKLQETLSMLI